uniref:Uncharacterized protein n=1 Tax=Anguilla anguilla TaxID=7936 RepID=A0A0E9XJB2_ANGAN
MRYWRNEMEKVYLGPAHFMNCLKDNSRQEHVLPSFCAEYCEYEC